MNADEITSALAIIGWVYVPKSRKAYYPTISGRIYLSMADKRDYQRLSASLQLSPRAHVTELSRLGSDISAASQTAQEASEILLRAYESSR
jgi:hypothetical protein